MRVISTAAMKAAEERVVERGGSYQQLMENAGSAAARAFLRRKSVKYRTVIVLAGKGNNGGDAFVVARLLHKAGAHVRVAMPLGEPVTEAAKVALAELYEIKPDCVIPFDDNALEEISRADYVVDGVLGTGFRGRPDESLCRLFACVNASPAYVMSLDIPSGVTADTGEVVDEAVRANLTVMFDSLKYAAIFRPSNRYCGECVTPAVGIEEEDREGLSSELEIPDQRYVKNSIPKRLELGHKGTSGRLLSICGCKGYVGSAVLCNRSAMRAGAGYVTVASVEEVCRQVVANLNEAVLCPLPKTEEGHISKKAVPSLLERIEASDAVLLGCGLGQCEDISELVFELIRKADKPMLLDADALNALAGHTEVLREAQVPLVLTPHLGEMARLTGKSVEEVGADVIGAARDFAAEYHVILLLKGHNTVTATWDGRISLNPTGNGGLAKAGSGDVLSGIIASLMAQGLPAFESAVCGAYLHGWAADLCREERSCRGMLPSELADYLCQVFLQLEK